MENMKELLLNGYAISHNYKTHPEQWLDDISIRIFTGGCGLNPKVSINGQENKDFELDEIDEAIKYFESLIESPDNLWYKMPEAIRTATETEPDIDLDEPEDFQRVNKLRLDLIKHV
jgi:hypothetical protein